MRVITLCGSLKFQKDMMIVAEKLSLEGNCVLTPVYPILENNKTDEQLQKLKEEVVDLEDMNTGISITDLGLNDLKVFRQIL